MANDTATLARCPTCGVKLHRTDLSLCAYCASPLKLGASAAPPDDETQRLFAKIQTHPAYADALQWTPMDARVDAKAARIQAWGNGFMVLTLLCVLAAAIFFSGAFYGRPPVWIAMFTVSIGGVLLAIAGTMRGNALNEPMLRRAARVLDRTSRTELDQRVGSTIYTFKLRFADGSEGEFELPGRGTMYEPPTVGATGVAYSRGTNLIEFKRL